jgi:transposase
VKSSKDIEQVVAAREAADDKQNKAAAAARVEKRRASRGALPAHLPRVHVTIEPEDWNCPCCRSPMHAIGADVSERLERVAAMSSSDQRAAMLRMTARASSGVLQSWPPD